MERQTAKGRLVLIELENLVSKLKLQSPEFFDLDSRIFPMEVVGGGLYVVDVSKGRISVRVTVDSKTARHLQSGQPDPNLLRELRIAMMSVARRARNRK